MKMSWSTIRICSTSNGSPIPQDILVHDPLTSWNITVSSSKPTSRFCCFISIFRCLNFLDIPSKTQKYKKIFEKWPKTQYVYPYTVKKRNSFFSSIHISTYFSSKIREGKNVSRTIFPFVIWKWNLCRRVRRPLRCTPSRIIRKHELKPRGWIESA